MDRHGASAISSACARRRVQREVKTARGSVSVLRWIDKRGVNARTFERKFCDAMGMVPKQYARAMRFRDAYRDLVSSGTEARRYLDAYYDQSHFYRDFRNFTGASPGMKIAGLLESETRICDHLMSSRISQQRDSAFENIG
jgi:AraC-like DNA-binding protein